MNLLITDELTLARSHSNAPTEFSGHSSHNYIPFVNTYKWLVVNYSLIVQYSDLTAVFIQENSHTNMEKASPRLEITFLMCTKVRNNKSMNIAVKCLLAPYSNTFRTVTITSIHIVGQVLQVWITWKFISKKFVKNSKDWTVVPRLLLPVQRITSGTVSRPLPVQRITSGTVSGRPPDLLDIASNNKVQLWFGTQCTFSHNEILSIPPRCLALEANIILS